MTDAYGQAFERAPINKHLGLELVSRSADRAVISMDVRPELIQEEGIMHGGIISTLLDEAMAYAAGKVFGVPAATAELTLRFISPLNIGENIQVRARVLKKSSRLAYCESEVSPRAGGVIARATAKLVKSSG